MNHTIRHDVDITRFSNFQTPATAKYYFEICNRQDIDTLFEVVQWAKEEKLPILFISGGTNMLFAFDIYKGLVIKNNLQGWSYNSDLKKLETYSTESIWKIAESLEKDYGQDLWHRFIGLPGSVAGAIYGNAGCFGLETENNFESCNVLNLENGQVSIFKKEEMNFSYRNSLLKDTPGKYFIISAIFDLSKKIEKYHSDVDNIDFRENKQPKGNSCGSFFKNPSREQSAGFLIEEVGLKGYRVGGAYFSEHHANFLMHDGTGIYKDMLTLLELAQIKVKEKFDIELENEVQIITNQK